MTTSLRDSLRHSADRAAALAPPVPDWLTPVRAGIRARQRRRLARLSSVAVLATGVLAVGAWSTLQGAGDQTITAGPPPAVKAAQAAVVRVTGTATACSRRLQGSGFYFAPHRVMTTAHTVAGLGQRLQVETADGRTAPAVVVLFDSDRDLAVLRTDALDEQALAFAGAASQGARAYAVGYPADGAETVEQVRIDERTRVRGPNIYQVHVVVRDTYHLTGRIRPGSAGGPLLSSDGRVFGVVLAQQAGAPNGGYALTADEVSSVASQGRDAAIAVSTGRCD